MTTVHSEIFLYRLADYEWHKVSLSVSGTELQLLVDCHVIYKKMIEHPPDRNFSASEMRLFVGQRSSLFQFRVSKTHT